jgi:SAM-dependent methyltransferase
LSFDVVGVDLSPESIEYASTFENEKLVFEVHDMRNLLCTNSFQYVLNLFTSFGYFERKWENEKVILNISKTLLPGGKLILDFLNVDRVKASLKEEEVVAGVLAEYHLTRSIQSDRIVKQIKFSVEDVNHIFEERVMAYSSEQITELLTLAGFEVITIWGDYHGAAMLASSPRCIFIAQKKQ